MKANVMFLLALFGLMLVAQAKPIDMEKRGKVGDIVQALFDGLKTGKATWFHPVTEGGPEGACDGIKEDDDSSIVALSLDLFGDEDAVSDFCKKKVWIKNKKNGKTVKATITDACPGCKKNSLDLTPKVFAALDDLNVGVLDIIWCVIGTKDCPGK